MTMEMLHAARLGGFIEDQWHTLPPFPPLRPLLPLSYLKCGQSLVAILRPWKF